MLLHLRLELYHDFVAIYMIVPLWHREDKKKRNFYADNGDSGDDDA